MGLYDGMAVSEVSPGFRVQKDETGTLWVTLLLGDDSEKAIVTNSECLNLSEAEMRQLMRSRLSEAAERLRLRHC